MSGGQSDADAGSGGQAGRRTDAPASAPASAPRMLTGRADPAPPPSPIQEADEIATLHAKFARLVSVAHGEAGDAPGGAGGSDGGAGGARGGGVRAKVRARVAAVARADAGADREFMGDLVRAVAAIAERTDDVTKRVTDLERLVQEVLDRLSEDLVRVQAAIGGLDDRGVAGRRDVEPPGNGPPGNGPPGSGPPGSGPPGSGPPGDAA